MVFSVTQVLFTSLKIQDQAFLLEISSHWISMFFLLKLSNSVWLIPSQADSLSRLRVRSALLQVTQFVYSEGVLRVCWTSRHSLSTHYKSWSPIAELLLFLLHFLVCHLKCSILVRFFNLYSYYFYYFHSCIVLFVFDCYHCCCCYHSSVYESCCCLSRH